MNASKILADVLLEQGVAVVQDSVQLGHVLRQRAAAAKHSADFDLLLLACALGMPQDMLHSGIVTRISYIKFTRQICAARKGLTPADAHEVIDVWAKALQIEYASTVRPIVLTGAVKTLPVPRSNDLPQHSEQDALWHDTRTGLMWSKLSVGQQWQDGAAEGKPLLLMWSSVQQQVEQYDLGGYHDWRLPSIDELRDLMADEAQTQLLSPAVGSLPSTWIYYWSSSRYAPASVYIWCADLKKHQCTTLHQDNVGAVRLVRDAR